MPAMMYRYQLNRLIRGKGKVLGADHDGDEEVAEHRRDRRDEEEEDHDLAVHA